MNKSATKSVSLEPKLSILHQDTSAEGLNFLKEHEIAVLSTVNESGDAHGAVVYYVVLNDFIYIVTKAETTKAHNIFSHSQVSLTVFEPFSAKTVQISGVAEVEKDTATRKNIFDQIVKPRKYKNGEQYPPVTKITEGSYTVIKITPTEIRYTDYSK